METRKSKRLARCAHPPGTGQRNRSTSRPGRLALLILLSAAPALVPACAPERSTPHSGGWPVYGGNGASSRYSELDQIHRGNVHRLAVAWVHRTGDLWEKSQNQCNPILRNGRLLAVSAGLQAIALDPGTGRLLWKFNPWTDPELKREDQGVSRGVSYWTDGREERVFFGASHRLYALDAATGMPIPDFGEQGWVDLRQGLGRDPDDLWVVVTTPGVVYRDLLIQGTRVSESMGAAPGHIRAYDVRTGRIRWTFHTIPQPGEPGYETWPPDAWKSFGGANSWAGMALDEGRGIVYVPTGSAAFDYYGGNRPGQNLYANCLLALDAATGRLIWHFQTVHHDIFDLDLPAPPNLVQVQRDGRVVDAVAQVTKSGLVFLFARESGEPLFEIEEQPVPSSDLPGEQAWPTQPVPTLPPPFARRSLSEEDLNDLFPQRRWELVEKFRRLRTGGPFLPASLQGSVFLPGLDGGAEWGGAAADPEGILYVNASNMAWILRMAPTERTKGTAVPDGSAVYGEYCEACHQADLGGDGERNPSLKGLSRRRSLNEVVRVVRQGKGFMPGFPMLSPGELRAVVAHLMDVPPAAVPAGDDSPEHEWVPYHLQQAERWFDREGYPAVKPPWGTLSAIDLNRGVIRWQVPLGEYPELTARGVPVTGTENYGGPVVTAGGLIFIGASRDQKFRAFDRDSGALLWEVDLPAGGYATPATYLHEGRQYVVIAAGGGKMGTPSGDAWVAYALP